MVSSTHAFSEMSCCGCYAWLRNRGGRDSSGKLCEQQALPVNNLQRDPLRCFSWEQLEHDLVERRALCEHLVDNGFAILSTSPSLHQTVSELQDLASTFFNLPRSERCALGKLRLFKDKVVGYREFGSGAARFLEVHRLSGVPAVMPRIRNPARLNGVAVKLHAELQAWARDLISWLADHVGVPPIALLQCIDDASLENLEDGDCGASVLRLCSYGFQPDDCDLEVTDVRADDGMGLGANGIFFDEHTDASFLTLAPVGSKPGLQMRDSTGLGWLDVERGLSSNGGHLVVFIGDFLEVLTKGKLTAARHRVAESGDSGHHENTLEHRMSMPFLVRGQPSAFFDTVSFVDACPDMPLLRLDKMRYANLRRFLDMKGRRRFSGHLLLTPSAAGDSEEQPTE